MPAIGPIKRRDLIANLRRVGFSGPYSGGRHEFMVKGELKLYVPNPHEEDIGRALLLRILRQAGIDRREWEKL
jgi:predicted RNA binding protein YcfA (HicA-like mRNA interferase family)